MTKRNVLIGLLILLFGWALSSQIAYSWWMVYLQSKSTDFVQVPYATHPFSRTVREVFSPYETSGLKAGDEVAQINGVTVDGDEQPARLWHISKPNDRVTVLVRRDSQMRTITFDLVPHVSESTEWPLTIIIGAVLPISCLLVGFYIALARPTDPLAWITMAMLASFSQAAGNVTPILLASPWREFLFVYAGVLTETWPLWMLLFALYFPIPFPIIKHRPWIAWALAMPLIFLAGLETYGNFRRLHYVGTLRWLAEFDTVFNTPHVILFTLYVSAFFACLTVKARTVKDIDARRRIRVMIAGCSLALTPSLPVAFSEIHLIPYLPAPVEAVCLSMLILFPATMAYVIVVRRAMEVRMVVRSGVQYAFARTGIRVLQIAIMVVVVAQTLRLAHEANRTVEELTIASIGVILVMSIRSIAERVHEWIDRRFFREAYNAERILADLSSSVASIRDVRELLETVAKRIAESMHVPGIAVLLENSGAYRPAYSLGTVSVKSISFKPESGVVQLLKRQRAPSKVDFADPQSWVHGAAEAEQESLRSMDTRVLLPLTLKSRLMGIISLTAKRSEEPYSRGDLQLLSAVASQTGLALENAELTESVRREVAGRERLNRELEIAREVQQRLFPQKLPIVSGLDFAGYCRPAEGVGGDYYDFVHLRDKSLGIAVGDVSGKGIAAALMMASLQASLRGQTIKPCETLSEMIQHINGLMYDASAENRYATFFYAQYDPEKVAMRYVNAGHNPPIVWRHKNGDHLFLRLEDGGTVVGLFPESPFREGFIQLEKGDVVVAFTDGISEAMNHADEEFEEERLIEALKRLQARTAAEMITQILAEVDGFTAGAKQHDDMTLVVIRVQ